MAAVYIYHITHLDNLPKIIEAGGLWSDRRLLSAGVEHTVIGFDHIKRRRLYDIVVTCHRGKTVGDFVPFYFCPRSPMLFKIQKRSERAGPDELRYRGGQRKVVHLVSTVEDAVALGRPYAFTPINAGASYNRKFYKDVSDLDAVLDWTAIRASQWPDVIDKKQAEFLVLDEFPWTAVVGIGTIDADLRKRVEVAVAEADHRPHVVVRRKWYY